MYKKMINNLQVSDEIKNVLNKINSAASSDNDSVKKSVKDLFIISPSCKELSNIGKCYERIIVGNSVYTILGSRTYLELAFPINGSEKNYKEFFASPGLAAATQDDFSGVFLISFEQWNRAEELLRDPAFKELKLFINKNKEKISFIFHVLPEFNNSDALFCELSKHLNIYLCEHVSPDMECAVSYVVTELLEAGLEVSPSARITIEKLIEKKINLSAGRYFGYETLDRFATNLKFELYIHLLEVRAKTGGKKTISVKQEDIEEIAEHIEFLNDEKIFRRTVGFC